MMLPLGPPSDRSAVIVRAPLPAGLERVRRGSVKNAADGVPAHVTMLHPFIAPERLELDVRRVLASVAAAHDAFEYSQAGPARWPGIVYVRVEPDAAFVRLQSALARAFPAFPIYGQDADFEFVPHVTIAEGVAADDPWTVADPAWAAVPRQRRASAVEVIARGASGGWRTVWRIGLGGRPRSGPR